MRIIWSPLAVERISEIAEYISQNNLDASTKWVDDIFTKIEQLNNFPESGRIVPEMNRNNIRELIYKNYRIVYRIESEQISILTVRHFKQIMPLEEIS